uniref:Uncharacterized protein n=1 Tax=Knipowitschia caucasica TaxID=637954 RepID=A0AAV2JH27_KNICA
MLSSELPFCCGGPDPDRDGSVAPNSASLPCFFVIRPVQGRSRMDAPSAVAAALLLHLNKQTLKSVCCIKRCQRPATELSRDADLSPGPSLSFSLSLVYRVTARGRKARLKLEKEPRY